MKDNTLISIVSADYIDGYVIKFTFNDGKEMVIDFHDFLFQSSNPMITRYVDVDVFKSFTLQHGDIVWGDYDLCFPVWDLYCGTVLHKNADSSKSAA